MLVSFFFFFFPPLMPYINYIFLSLLLAVVPVHSDEGFYAPKVVAIPDASSVYTLIFSGSQCAPCPQ